MNPCQFFKCLADETRLKTLLLISQTQEACVCDLMASLQLEQPKISRHLAELRKYGIVEAERRGKWIYYRLHPALPTWASEVIHSTATDNTSYFKKNLTTLQRYQQENPGRC